MEPLIPTFVPTAGPGLVHVVGGGLGVLVLTATGLVLGGTAAERESRALALGRLACVTFTGLLVSAGFLGLLTRWAFAVACVACLLAVLAVALRFGQGTSLRAYLDAPGDGEEPSWWPLFEHRFHRYASTPRREQNPLRRAVTRPTPRTTDADRGRPARRHPDVMTGGRP
jgi:hypothetical protein